MTDFALGNEVWLEGKTWKVFRCGCPVFKLEAQRKSLINLLLNFDKFLEECDGVRKVFVCRLSVRVLTTVTFGLRRRNIIDGQLFHESGSIRTQEMNVEALRYILREPNNALSIEIDKRTRFPFAEDVRFCNTCVKHPSLLYVLRHALDPTLCLAGAFRCIQQITCK